MVLTGNDVLSAGFLSENWGYALSEAPNKSKTASITKKKTKAQQVTITVPMNITIALIQAVNDVTKELINTSLDLDVQTATNLLYEFEQKGITPEKIYDSLEGRSVGSSSIELKYNMALTNFGLSFAELLFTLRAVKENKKYKENNKAFKKFLANKVEDLCVGEITYQGFNSRAYLDKL